MMTPGEVELAKSGMEVVLKPLVSLAAKLFGGAAVQLGGMLDDELAARRTIRRIKLLQRVQNVIDDTGIDPRQIPDDVWVPALQAATLQDSEFLRAQWANLLATAADPRRPKSVPPSFV